MNFARKATLIFLEYIASKLENSFGYFFQVSTLYIVAILRCRCVRNNWIEFIAIVLMKENLAFTSINFVAFLIQIRVPLNLLWKWSIYSLFMSSKLQKPLVNFSIKNVAPCCFTYREADSDLFLPFQVRSVKSWYDFPMALEVIFLWARKHR